jgi:hypothetical protein
VSLVPGGLPSEALIAKRIVSKFGDHHPFYRQALIFYTWQERPYIFAATSFSTALSSIDSAISFLSRGVLVLQRLQPPRLRQRRLPDTARGTRTFSGRSCSAAC